MEDRSGEYRGCGRIWETNSCNFAIIFFLISDTIQYLKRNSLRNFRFQILWFYRACRKYSRSAISTFPTSKMGFLSIVSALTDPYFMKLPKTGLSRYLSANICVWMELYYILHVKVRAYHLSDYVQLLIVIVNIT